MHRRRRSSIRWWQVRRWLAPRRAKQVAAAVLAALLAIAALTVLNREPALRVSEQSIPGTPEPGGGAVLLDSSLYLPERTPAPAILLAHGFGGSKAGLDGQARTLARAGYVVLTYTARGFGASGGLIHLDSRRYEVADGSRLLDFLQARPEVARAGERPVLGVAGSSYGGALALMLGATDQRIAAVAADITWNNLARALFPNAAATGADQRVGVFKRLWAGYLFSSGFNAASAGGSGSNGAAPGGAPPGGAAPGGAAPGGTASGGVAPGGGSVSCGRFAAELCASYQRAVAGGPPDVRLASLLAESSPAGVLDGMRAPTLLTQGDQDSLFPLSEADANARQIAAAGAQVQVRWRAGGHDASGANDDVSGIQRRFFDQKLRGRAGSSAEFLLSQPGAGISASSGRTVAATLRASGYPGLPGRPGFTSRQVTLNGQPRQISAPAGGSPAAVSTVPGLGDLIGGAAGLGLGGAAGLSRLPGQSAVFSSDPLVEPALVIGSSEVRLRVTAGRTGEATLFVSLHDLGPDGSDTLPARLVSPVRLTGRPGQVQLVTVRLPWIVAEVPAGHRLAVEVSTTDFAYQLPTEPATYTVALGETLAAPGATLSVASLPVIEVRTGGARAWVIAAALVVLLCLAYGWWRLRSRRPHDADPALAQVPIVVSDLAKVYADGYRAVDGVSFRVERGQVLGLLGPNGAGKTTTLRVLMGLILPTAGSIRVFGHEVVPGARVLSRLGAFVEGPGFLPHLSGRENLRLFWAASGRTVKQAQFETVLEIAGLGDSLERRVKTYSHGMQQRLAIAQAMLGLPEVLVLDEPTNGLDPPQIAEMRVVLGRYAATGRTVIVSSHLLAEVEQTCTHVVVMHRGRLVAAGSVAEVAGSGSTQLAVDDVDRAREVLTAAGVPARVVPARRALEDVFLDLIGERVD
ncbi:alpha/beta fold hydrolase [Jatrophihabitans sp.]|jgi:ABC-2 type transport system ATP-binding protein|uniref:alpha/beta fold hydrolase n=1 Tax=Jatrophihabitans sp. TaxID=1932789 RepID=UPI0038CDB968